MIPPLCLVCGPFLKLLYFSYWTERRAQGSSHLFSISVVLLLLGDFRPLFPRAPRPQPPRRFTADTEGGGAAAQPGFGPARGAPGGGRETRWPEPCVRG